MFKLFGKSFQYWNSALGIVTIFNGKYLPLCVLKVGDKNLALSEIIIYPKETVLENWFTQTILENENMYEFWAISYNHTKSVQCTKFIESSKILFFLNFMFMAHITQLPIFMRAL